MLNSDFLKQFKTAEELESFIIEIHRRAVEKILEGELDEHLGYEKYSLEGKNSGNSRHGTTTKTIKSEHEEAEIEVTRDRNGSFEPVLVPKRGRLAQGIENLVISLYAKGMSNSDIEEQLKEIYDFRLSLAAIFNITTKIHQDIIE